MENKLFVHNTLSRKKEEFKPVKPPYVGMYVCGPTVYGDAHLGHARPAVAFDLIYRYLMHLGYKVRYVRNITDVGHLEDDADEGEDKIAKKARIEKLEPMEVVQHYTNRYHQNMDALNVLRPSIEPHASGHIIEQIELVKKIRDKGMAYETNGSLYFDIEKYNQDHRYGILSGRKLEDLMSETRSLEGQDEKKSSFDFAIWKKAQPEHIMRWPSPWSDGFPGWHAECSAMGIKYLGEEFDIHGGGMDLLFPHHEAEIAQSTVAYGKSPVKYWLHNNMVTLEGKKMGKSLGNAIPLYEVFSGEHKLMEKAYSPMTIRFFILMAHYRSTLDFSNEALQAAEKGLKRLMQAMQTLEDLKAGEKSDFNIQELEKNCYEAMNDDFNSPVVISQLFEGVKIINSVHDKKASLTEEDLDLLQKVMRTFTFDILGLQEESKGGQDELIDYLMQTLLDIRQNARKNKDFATSDKIRDELARLNIVIKDSKEGS
ncbi:MAG: cysteine--tRNA ligase, partial [Bacteroidales bacterium]|nr:cysteine--tRNA ligase [Bacteroidales bacterium]